jgi:hypothetical protein
MITNDFFQEIKHTPVPWRQHQLHDRGIVLYRSQHINIDKPDFDSEYFLNSYCSTFGPDKVYLFTAYNYLVDCECNRTA